MSALEVSIDAGVATVTIDNPPINLFDVGLMFAMAELGQTLAADDDVRAVVVTSADEDFWIAHADVEMILQLPRDQGNVEQTDLNIFHAMCETFRTMPKLTVAAVEGIARGGGAEFAASFDLRVAGESAVLCQPEVALGILPGGSGTQRLAELVGRSRALQIVLACEDVDAATAAAWGWVNEVVPDGRVVDRAAAIARQAASFPAVALAEAKASVLVGTSDPTPGLLQEAQRFNRLLAEPEAIARMERFLELGGQTREVERDLTGLYDQLG